VRQGFGGDPTAARVEHTTADLEPHRQDERRLRAFAAAHGQSRAAAAGARHRDPLGRRLGQFERGLARGVRAGRLRAAARFVGQHDLQERCRPLLRAARVHDGEHEFGAAVARGFPAHRGDDVDVGVDAALDGRGDRSGRFDLRALGGPIGAGPGRRRHGRARPEEVDRRGDARGGQCEGCPGRVRRTHDGAPYGRCACAGSAKPVLRRGCRGSTA
jgi:hypothetical protein